MTEEQLEKIKFFESTIEKETDSAKKIKLWYDYRNYFSYINPSFSLEIIERGCEFAKTVSEEDYFNMLFSKSNSLTQLERFKESYDLLLKCFNFYVKQNNHQMIVKSLGGISNIFTFLELYTQSIFILKMILSKYTSDEDILFRFVANVNLIQLYLNKFEEVPYDIEDIDSLIASNETKLIESPHPYLILNITKARLFANVRKDYQSAISIFNEVINKGEELHIDVMVRDAKYFLALCHKDNGDFKIMEKILLEVLSINKKINSNNHNSDIYNELYNYYTKENRTIKALESYEKYQLFRKENEIFKSNMNSKIDLLGYSKEIDINNELFNSVFKSKGVENDNTLLITDIKGVNHRLKIQDIIQAQKNVDILKIYLVMNNPIYTNMSFKEFLNKIETFGDIRQLFFETNLRSQVVNLFWMSKIDISTKTIFLKAIDVQYDIVVSKRQFPLLKKHLLQNNIYTNYGKSEE